MVAVASPSASTATVATRPERQLGWIVAAAASVLVGDVIRLAFFGTAGAGDRSAAVMATLLSIGAWFAARLLAGPRVALVVTVVLVALFDLAALPARTPPEYDDLQAFYRTDQILSAQVPVAAGANRLTLLGEPVFQGPQAAFGIAGEVNGTRLSWRCGFTHGIQRLALSLPPGLSVSAPIADLQLHLTGSPSREGDFLLVYSSSQRGGFLVSLEPASSPRQGDTSCALE